MKKLYKYRGANKLTEEILTQNRLYFSFPLDFNDPFDFKLPVSYKAPKKVIKQKLIRIFNEYLGISKRKSKLQADEIVSSITFNPDKLRQLSEWTINQLMRATVVFCLSEKNDDILMWSHYSDGHKGVCIEFEMSEENLLYGAKPVHYVDEYPELNIYMNSKSEIEERMIFYKSSQWSYEKEWRIVQNYVGTNFYTIKEQAITAIIYGYLCSNETKEKYNNLIKNRSTPIRVYQAKKKSDKFGLNIE